MENMASIESEGPHLVAPDFSRSLKDSGYQTDTRVRFSSKNRPRTNSHAAYEMFVQMSGAPDVLELLHNYGWLSGLVHDHDFSVSCLPANNRAPRGTTRVSAISVGMVEVLVIYMTREEGQLAHVRFYLEPDEDLSWSSGDISDTHLDGGGQVVEYYGRDAIIALEDEHLVEAIVRRLMNMRSRSKRYRRDGWHNPWLWNLASRGKVSGPRESSSISQAENFAIEDVWRMQRQRTGQQKFRAALLEQHPAECAICGLDIIEVLEAAHLVPHSTAVDYRPHNGRLLCANHHRAFDAGLYEWKIDQFTWIGSGPEPFLGGTDRSS